VENNLLKRRILEYFDDVIRNCALTNLTQHCMNFEERWGATDLKFNVAT
jgi:hypothetical protein